MSSNIRVMRLLRSGSSGFRLGAKFANTCLKWNTCTGFFAVKVPCRQPNDELNDTRSAFSSVFSTIAVNEPDLCAHLPHRSASGEPAWISMRHTWTNVAPTLCQHDWHTIWDPPESAETSCPHRKTKLLQGPSMTAIQISLRHFHYNFRHHFQLPYTPAPNLGTSYRSGSSFAQWSYCPISNPLELQGFMTLD